VPCFIYGVQYDFRMTADWDLAGMTDNAGDVGKLVPAGRVLIPGSITLESECIKWKITGQSHLVMPDRSMLNGFVRLWDQQSKAVYSFAKKWGVLAIGQHNRPCAEGTAGRDSIEAWRFYSRRAMAVLNLIAAAKQGKIGGIEDWRELGATNDSLEEWERAGDVAKKFPLPQLGGFPRDVRAAATSIANELNAWMEVWREKRFHAVSDFRVDNTGPGKWEMQVDFHGMLFPAIALQLCLVTVAADTLYCCSDCGHPFVRPREKNRPRPGLANYCPECIRLGIPARRASKRYRERKADAQRERAEATKTRKR
jgi:hypothetical protein